MSLRCLAVKLHINGREGIEKEEDQEQRG